MLFAILVVAAVSLTCAMFATRNSILGFPSAIFWAIAGGQAYITSASTWDIYFLIAFACLLGMVTFTVLGAYGLREKRDSLGDEAMGKSEGPYLDENSRRGRKPGSQKNEPEQDIDTPDEDEFEAAAHPSPAQQRLHNRINQRKGDRATRLRNGEFR